MSTLVTTATDPETGAVTAELRIGSAVLGEVRYAHLPQLLFIWEVVPSTPGRLDHHGLLIEALLGERREDEHLMHGHLTAPRDVLAYASSPVALGACLTGGIAGETLWGVPLLEVPDALLRRATEADTSVSLMWEPVARGEPIDARQLHEGLVAPDPNDRIHALRASTWSAAVDPIREAAFQRALLDPAFEVRRFASVTMAGGFPSLPWRASPQSLVAHVVDPLQSMVGFELPPGPFDATHGARNKRRALLWALGLLAARREASTLALIDPLLGRGAREHTPAHDAILDAAAAADLSGQVHRGLGGIELAGVFDLCRYAVLRHRRFAALHGPGEDVFYWLLDMVHSLAPPADAPDPLQRHDPATTRALYA